MTAVGPPLCATSAFMGTEPFSTVWAQKGTEQRGRSVPFWAGSVEKGSVPYFVFGSRFVVKSAAVMLSTTPRAGTSAFAIQRSAFSTTRR